MDMTSLIEDWCHFINIVIKKQNKKNGDCHNWMRAFYKKIDFILSLYSVVLFLIKI